MFQHVLTPQSGGIVACQPQSCPCCSCPMPTNLLLAHTPIPCPSHAYSMKRWRQKPCPTSYLKATKKVLTPIALLTTTPSLSSLSLVSHLLISSIKLMPLYCPHICIALPHLTSCLFFPFLPILSLIPTL
jgi:hypothetical protein